MTRLIDADALMEKSFEIEYADGWHKSVTKEVVSVRDIENAPTIDPNKLDLDIDYSIEYDKRPDGISNAKVTITRIKPSKSTEQNVADVPSGETVSRADVLALINKAMFNTDNKDIQDYIFNGLRRDIHNLPSAEYSKPLQTTLNDDLISREDAIKAVEQEYKIDRGYMADDYTYGFNQAIQYVSDIILHDLPSVDRPKGEWIDEDGDKVEIDDSGITECSCWCSVCGEWLVASDEYPTKGNFCPNCGADMRGEK